MDKLSPTRTRSTAKRYDRNAIFLAIDQALDKATVNTKEGFGLVHVKFNFQNGGICETIIRYEEAVKI